MNKKRLLKLADFLEKLPRKLFDIGIIREGTHTNLEEAMECGTKACAVGWCPTVFPRLCKVKESQIVSTTKRNLKNFALARNLFDLNHVESAYLFTSNSDYSAKMTARRIRAFVERGGLPKGYFVW